MAGIVDSQIWPHVEILCGVLKRAGFRNPSPEITVSPVEDVAWVLGTFQSTPGDSDVQRSVHRTDVYTRNCLFSLGKKDSTSAYVSHPPGHS